MRTLSPLVVVFGVVACAAGCGEEPLIATFTSEVVQLESCRTVGDAEEGCARDEVVAELRTELVEADDDTFWLYGVNRGGVDDRAVLGTRDSVGGFLFVDALTQSDSSTGCVVTTETSLSLSIEAGREADVGGDDCVALVGRQVETTSTSAECDAVSDPPQQVVRTVRKRWQPLDAASTCGQ